MATEFTRENFLDIQGTVCDSLSSLELNSRLSSSAGLVIASSACDASGNLVFQYDTILKYHKAENGTEKITAEVAGKIIAEVVFDLGMRSTLTATLATASAALDNESLILLAGSVGVYVNGYFLVKEGSDFVGRVSSVLIYNEIVDKDDRVKIININNDPIFDMNPKENITEITEDEQTQKNLLPHVKTEKVKINEAIYTKRDIHDYTNLELRNLLDSVSSVNVLLSNITIKVNEKLDIGTNGIYLVKDGDTFSEIANENGFSTKELLEKNTWLIDLGRIEFNTPTEVLVEENAIRDNITLDHTLKGSDADDILRDLNGGNDTLEGGEGTNLLDGGEGNDTVSYSNASTGINVNLSVTTAQVINEFTTDTLINIESIIGSDKNDDISGGVDIDSKLDGLGGDDYIFGGTTKDELRITNDDLVENRLYGGSGEDFLVSSIFADNYLYGGEDNDILISSLLGSENNAVGLIKGSAYLNGEGGNDKYYVSGEVTIEDSQGQDKIYLNATLENLADLTVEIRGDKLALLRQESVTSYRAPFAGYGGFAGSILGNQTVANTSIVSTTVALVTKEGNDLVINTGSSSITIKNYNFGAGSFGLKITADMFSNTPIVENPNIDGSDSSENLFGTEINNVFDSNKGDDSIKDTAGGNDIYKFSSGDGKDSIYDISGNDVIQFDETVLKEDITFKESANKKDLILTYSSRSEIVDGTEVIIEDYITITDYFNDISKIENILLSDGTKIKPDFNYIVTGTDTSENIIGSNNYEREAS